MHPEIRTIVIGEPQKIILSPRVEVRRVVKHVPAIIDRQHDHQFQHHHQHHQHEMEPKIQIITKPYNPPRPMSPQHVHVIKDSRQQQQQQHYNNDGETYQNGECSPRKYIVSRQINVISTSSPSSSSGGGSNDGNGVFRTPVVSSTTTAANASAAAAAAASAMMRPPPPPPPPSVKIKTANLNEEPSSSIPDLGKSVLSCVQYICVHTSLFCE